MIININKDKVEIIEQEENINSGAVQYYEVELLFDESWNGLTKKAVLIHRESKEAQDIAVVDNKLCIDVGQDGSYDVGFVGYTLENEKKIYQISTILETFYVYRGAGEIETSNKEVPMPTEWELYLAQIQEIINGATEEITNNVLTSIQPTLDKNLQDMKDYTDKEIATFDFIKIVQELPETGLPNRTYFVAKANTNNNDLYEEYMWINEKWEPLGTKQIEVDLTNYLSKDEVEEDPFEITYEDGNTRTVRSVVFK